MKKILVIICLILLLTPTMCYAEDGEYLDMLLDNGMTAITTIVTTLTTVLVCLGKLKTYSDNTIKSADNANKAAKEVKEVKEQLSEYKTNLTEVIKEIQEYLKESIANNAKLDALIIADKIAKLNSPQLIANGKAEIISALYDEIKGVSDESKGS